MTDGPDPTPAPTTVQNRQGGNPHVAVTTGNAPGRVVTDASQNILTYCESAYERELQNRVNQRIKQKAHENFERQSHSWDSFMHLYPSEQQGLKNLQTLPPETFMTPDERGRYNVIQDYNNQIDHQNLLAFNAQFGMPASPNHVPDQKAVDAARAKAQDICNKKQAINDSYKPSFTDKYGPQIGQGLQNFGNAMTELGMSGGHPEEPMPGGGRRSGPAIHPEPEEAPPTRRPPAAGAPPAEPSSPGEPEPRAPTTPSKPAPAEDGEAPPNRTGKTTGPPDEPEGETKPPDGDAVKKKKKRGDPVAVATGEFIEEWEDFRLPGTIVVDGSRSFGHRRGRAGPLGLNRTSGFDVTIEGRGTRLVLFDEDGRRIHFERPFNLSGSRGIRAPGYDLRAPWLKQLDLRDGHLVRHFRQGGDGIYRLVAAEDRNGNRIDYLRSADGVLERANHSDGFHLRFDNTAEGLRAAVTLVRHDGGERRLASYTYDANRNMVAADCATTFSLRYDYDARGRLQSWRDQTGRSWGRLHFDAMNRVVRTETSGQWNNDTFAYDDEQRITTYRPGGGAECQRFLFDADDNVLWEENALGERYTHVYENGNRVATTDPLGGVRRWSYDDLNNITAMADEEGRRTLLRWGQFGELQIAIEPSGAVWRWVYDGHGNVVERTDPLRNTVRYAWTAAGRLAATVHADGATERRSYDAHHRLVEIVDRAGGRTAIARDADGRITTVTDPTGSTTRYGYADGAQAPLDFVTRVTRADGVVMVRTLDDHGQAETDGEGRTTRRMFGSFDRLVRTVDPLGGETTVDYDVAGRVTRVTNPKGAVYRFERDRAGRVVAAVDFDGRPVRFRYDAAGNIVERHAADGSHLAFLHNRAGQLVESRAFEPGAAEPSEVERFAYDGGGALRRAENAAARVVFDRDLLGRIVGEATGDQRLASMYDPAGHRIERRIGDVGARYGYDPVGSLIALHLDQTAVSIKRDAAGRDVERSSLGGFVLRQDFDRAGQLLAQTAGAARQTDGELFRRAVSWNAAFEPLSSTDSLWGRSTYAYDANGQVREARHGLGAPGRWTDPESRLAVAHGDPIEVERYAYDAGHDVAASDQAGPQTPLGRALSPWSVSAGGVARVARGPSGTSICLTHDRRGRVIERRVERDGFRPKVWTYRWNPFDRLIGCSTPEGQTWRYAYDALGRRVSKRRDDTVVQVPGAVVGRAFLWDRDALAADAPIHADGTVAWDRGAAWHGPADSPVPLLRVEAGTVHHIVSDQVGTPREAWDEAGNLVWAQAHRVWGAAREVWRKPANDDQVSLASLRDADAGDGTAAEQPGARRGTEVAVRFPGQWADDENGLHYNRFRYYDPLTTQYASPDPIALEGGLRPQAYVGTPTAGSDALGLADRTGGQFNSFYDYNLPSNSYYSSDPQQFNLANQSFISQMNSDPAFRQDMLSRYPGLQSWMESPTMSGSPPGLTWHHTDTPGKLSLVDRNDHSKQHGIYHPTGRGGRAKWGGGEAGRRGQLNPDGTPRVKAPGR